MPRTDALRAGFGADRVAGRVDSSRYMSRTGGALLVVSLLGLTASVAVWDGMRAEHVLPGESESTLGAIDQVDVRYNGLHTRFNGREYYGDDCLSGELQPRDTWTIDTDTELPTVVVPTTDNKIARFVVSSGQIQPADQLTHKLLTDNNC